MKTGRYGGIRAVSVTLGERRGLARVEKRRNSALVKLPCKHYPSTLYQMTALLSNIGTNNQALRGLSL